MRDGITWCMVLPMKPAWVIPKGNSSSGHVVGSLLNLCLQSKIPLKIFIENSENIVVL